MASVFRNDMMAGKVAYFAGATGGIGLGVARRFAEHGAHIYVAGAGGENVEAAVQTLASIGGTASGMAVDLRAYEEVKRSVSACADKLGKIDVVFAAATVNFPAPAVAMSDRAFKTVVDTELTGTFNTLRATFEKLNVPGASMIALTAPQAEAPFVMQAHACAARAGVRMMIKTLAMEWGPVGVRVNTVSAGAIDEAHDSERLGTSPDQIDRMLQRQPISRLGTVDEVADACLFLASDAARYVTGVSLNVDGGMVLGDAQIA